MTKNLSLAFAPELIIDNFAGGGGTSTGLEAAFGRPVDIAINHDPEALAMHAANHPYTKHLCESVWDIDPIEVTKNQPVALVWLSPDCKHFSKAKGGKPVEKRIRGLAWVALRWAAKCKPRVIMLENVEEFKTWGPLIVDENGHAKPDPNKKGKTFESFIRQLKGHGYEVDYFELRACDYGAPTIRKRFFLVARRDGIKIQKPNPTHGAPESKGVKSGKLKPYLTAADCIDWSLPCPSIFNRKKPLADKTLARIAKGIMRYVVETCDPFIVKFSENSLGQRCDEPLHTVMAGAPRFGIIEPTIAPFINEHANASNQRVMPAEEPLRTICAQVKGGHYSVVSAFLAKHFTGVVGTDIRNPISTVTSIDHHSLVTAHVTKFRTGAIGSGLDEPLHTVTAGGQQARPGTGNAMGIVTANLVRQFGNSIGSAVSDPIGTITAGGQGKTSLVTSSLVKLRGDNVGQAIDKPLATISAGGQHHAEVSAFLLSYYGSENDSNFIDKPVRTVTSRDRFGLVTIKGQDYQIVDIGLRMLQPRELYRAQGFPDSYIIGDDPKQGLSLTKSAQVRMCGNSVCPPVALALINANFKHEKALLAA